MAEWRTVRLGDAAALTRGVSYNGAGLNKPGPTLIGMGQVRVDGGLDLTDARTYGGKVKTEHFLDEQDVALVMTDLTQSGGLLGSACRAPTALVNQVVISHHLQRCRCEPSLDPHFAFYLFMGPTWRSHVNGMATGTTVRAVSPQDAERFEFLLPPLEEQRAIAGVLGALDDKIESNRRIWVLRLRQAEALYLSVSARATGTTPLASLYEVGLSGVWGEDSESEKAVVATSCLRGRDLEDYVRGEPDSSPTRFISPRQMTPRAATAGEIWTAGSGSLGPSLLITPGVLRRWDKPVTYSNFVKRLVPSTEHGLASLAWLAMRRAWMTGEFTNFRTGTAMPNLDAEALLRGVLVPTVGAADAAAVDEATNWSLDPQLLRESDALVALRDALLPELLSGRLRVPDAEATETSA